MGFAESRRHCHRKSKVGSHPSCPQRRGRSDFDQSPERCRAELGTTKERFFNLLEGFRECASLSLSGTGQREGGAFREANMEI